MGKKLKEENKQLRKIIAETIWMARRYADKRSTMAPKTLNECLDLALNLGIKIDSDPTMKGFYAEDGMFGEWNPETRNFKGN